MLNYLLFPTFATIVCGLVASLDAATPTVDLGYAQYQGYFDAQANTTNFLGIRYAVPPIGALRFRAPLPPVSEPGVRHATQNPSQCYQAGFGTNTTGGVTSHRHKKRQSTAAASEDCLFLNVFVPGSMPVGSVTGKLPVLVWIHGGGYQSGSAALYDGSELVAGSLGTVVVVVIQYRLGAFGFLSGNEVKANGALNAGLLDQNLALQWVQQHIELFGGDKDHVTIWGDSAGGGSVLQHIVANGGNTQPPLFHAAITSSLFLPSQYHYNDEAPQLLYNQVADQTGCALHADTFTCLQLVNASTLETVNYDLANSAFYGTFIFVPVVDGSYIAERPTITLSEGRVNGQVLLAVTNQNEGNIFVNVNETLTTIDYISLLFPNMMPSQVQEAAYMYQDYGTPVEQAMMVMGDSIFVCPTHYLLIPFTGRSWKGLFAVPPGIHGSDIPYYFYNPNQPPSYNNTEFITAFSHSFMSVAKYYDVNMKIDATDITPNWNKYAVGKTEMLFDRTEAGAPVVVPIQTDPSLLQRCAFWSTVTAQTAQ